MKKEKMMKRKPSAKRMTPVTRTSCARAKIGDRNRNNPTKILIIELMMFNVLLMVPAGSALDADNPITPADRKNVAMHHARRMISADGL